MKTQESRATEYLELMGRPATAEEIKQLLGSDSTIRVGQVMRNLTNVRFPCIISWYTNGVRVYQFQEPTEITELTDADDAKGARIDQLRSIVEDQNKRLETQDKRLEAFSTYVRAINKGSQGLLE